MNRKQMIALIAAGVVLLVLICILVVGLVDGIWPWDGITAYGRLITNRPQAQATEPEETTESTEAGDSEPSGESSGEASGNKQIGETSQEGSPATLPKEENSQVDVEVDGVVIPSGGSSTDSTDSTGSTDSEGEGSSTDADAVVDFRDLG